MPDVSTRNYFLKFSIVVWLQPRSPLFQVCAITTRLFFNPSTVNKMKLYRYSKSSFGYLWTKTESTLDHQQRVYTLQAFISCHAISTGSFFCQVNFPICNGLQFQHWVKWPWTWSCGIVLCTVNMNMSLWFLPSDVYFSLICLKTTKSLSDGFSVEKFFPRFVKGSKYIQFGTRLIENSSDSQSNLASNHLGWSERYPMGGIALNFPNFFQQLKNTLYHFFLSQRAQPAPGSQPSIHLHQTLTVFCIQENLFLVVI